MSEFQSDTPAERTLKTVAAGAAGALMGKGAIAATGMTAAGMMGGGTGIGAAAGPVGAVIGAITGLAAYGVYRLFAGQNAPGPTPEQLRRIEDLKAAHDMSFFQQQGMIAWVTPPTNDGGVDGFARHEEGLIVVQCKRYAPDKAIDRPTVQQLRGVIEENHAWRGYLVTTSRFSKPAIECAEWTEKLVLVDMDALVDWHLGKAKPVP